MFKREDLIHFIHQAHQKGYASGEQTGTEKETDGSTSIHYQEGEWKSHDNFFGGEPYGGREVIFFQNKPVWIMLYYGWVDPSVEDIKSLYSFLQKALSRVSEEAPFRGPAEFKDEKLTYQNSWEGTIESFVGHEEILDGETVVYQADYMGGLVDTRKEE